MIIRGISATLAFAGLLVLVALGFALPGGSLPTSAAAVCPIVLRVEGSTTVEPITTGSVPLFESAWVGTDVQSASIGSGAGLTKLLAQQIEVAPSSRALNATEQASAFSWRIGRDGFVMAVQDSPAMDFINNITKAQVKQIYEGTLTNWNQLGAPGSHPIVPRARITASGSQPDFLSVFAVNSLAEQNTINATGLSRLTESSDMAQAAADNAYQIAYTSLSNVNTPGLKVLTLDGVAPTVATVQGNTYGGLRTLRLAVLKTSVINRIDNSATVLGDDWVNFALSTAGQNVVAAQGFVPEPVPALPPIPDWDINMDGNTSLSDLGAITGKWGQSSSCRGWIRADANNNNAVSLSDIGIVTGKWGNQGFVPQNQ